MFCSNIEAVKRSLGTSKPLFIFMEKSVKVLIFLFFLLYTLQYDVFFDHLSKMYSRNTNS